MGGLDHDNQMHATRQKVQRDVVNFEIIRADRRHRDAINRLITKTNIGSPYKEDEPMEKFWVARVGGKIVACHGLDFWDNGRVAIFTSAAVEKEFRHKGICSALMRTATEYARRRGADTAALCSMYYLFRFLKHRGFKTCPRKLLPESVRSYPQFTAKRYMKCAVMLKYI